MLPFQPTTTLQYGDQTFSLDKMSERVQQLVAYMDDWRQKEADALSSLLMIRAGIAELQNTLRTTLDEERAAALTKAESMGLIPTADQTPTPDSQVA